MNIATLPNTSISKLVKLFSWTLFIAALVCSSARRIDAAGTFIPAPARVDMVYDAGRDLLYITNGDHVLRYQISTNTFLTPFVVGRNLRGLDLSPDGNTLVIADEMAALGNFVWVYVIDLRTQQITAPLFPRAFAEGGTYAIAYGNDDTVLIMCTVEGSGDCPLRKYNPGTGFWQQLALIRNFSTTRTSGDLGTIAIAETDSSDGPYDRYRISEGNLLRKFGPNGAGWYTYEIGVNRDGTQYAIPTLFGTQIADANLNKFHVLGQSFGPQPIGVVYHPVENIVYFAWSTTTEVRAFDTVNFNQIAAYDFEYLFTDPGNRPFKWGRLRTSRDGSLLFATVEGGVRFIRLYDPLVAQSQSITVTEDTPTSITLNGTVGNGGAVSYVITANPSHGSVTGTAPDLTYQPDANYYGPDSFSFKAVYGSAVTAEATVSINVQRVNDNPDAQPDEATTIKGTSVTIEVLANDTDVEEDELSVVAVTSPANGKVSITASGRTVNYKPRSGFTGTDTFTYTVSDGEGGLATATVTVTVLPR